MESLRFLSMAASDDGGAGAGAGSSRRVIDFQRNCSFAAFILVVVMCSLLLLVNSLRTVLLPIIWAAFFALPLERAVKFLSHHEVGVISCLLRACRGPQPPCLPVPFWYVPGRNRVRVESTEGSLAILAKVNDPLSSCPCRRRVPGATPAMPGRLAVFFSSCCRRRVRILQLEAQHAPGPNRFKQGSLYHVSLIEPSADGHTLSLELSVDGLARYPAIFDEEESLEVEAVGTLEVDKTSNVSWMFAIVFVIMLVLVGVAVFASLIYIGAESLVTNEQDYVKGVNDFFDWFNKHFKDLLPADEWKSMQVAIQKFLSDSLPLLATSLLEGISSFLVQATFMVIYLLFWLVEPIPVAPSVGEVFKRYLLLKTFVCLLFASLMSFVLWMLNVKIWPLFFVLTFLLNYIPEIGSMLCGLLSVFVVLFDGSIKGTDQRVYNALILMLLFGIIKVATANVIEMRMYANNGGEFMRMHPVVLLAMIFVGQALLGLSGMFLSVPITAALKYYLLSSDVPPTFLDPMLVFIEGDEMAPHRNYVDKRRAEQQRKLEARDETPQAQTSQTHTLQTEAAEARSPLLTRETSLQESSRTTSVCDLPLPTVRPGTF